MAEFEADGLPHEPNRVIIGFTKSRDGLPVIGMTINNQEWILLATMQALTVDRLRAQLKKDFDSDSLPDFPFDWRESLKRRELVLFSDTESLNKPVGIFVPADKFDDLPKP